MWDLGPGADSYWSLFAVEPQAKHSYGHVTSKNPDEKEGGNLLLISKHKTVNQSSRLKAARLARRQKTSSSGHFPE